VTMNDRRLDERFRAYGAVIDQELREARIDGAARRRRSSSSPVMARALVGACALLVALPLLLIAVRSETAPTSSPPGVYVLDLDDIPQGVTVQRLGEDSVFVRRDEREVVVFAADARHLPGEALWWCPAQRVFTSPQHGESFDADGKLIFGPAQGGMLRFDVQVTGDRVTVDMTHTIDSSARDDGSFDRGAIDGPWVDDSGIFCDGALKADG
jgi:hypothetical protein